LFAQGLAEMSEIRRNVLKLMTVTTSADVLLALLWMDMEIVWNQMTALATIMDKNILEVQL